MFGRGSRTGGVGVTGGVDLRSDTFPHPFRRRVVWSSSSVDRGTGVGVSVSVSGLRVLSQSRGTNEDGAQKGDVVTLGFQDCESFLSFRSRRGDRERST